MLSTHESGVFWAKMVENPVLLDLQHLGRFLWLLIKAALSFLEVAAATVPCFTCKMVVVHFWLCYPDFITYLLRSVGFQNFRIASIMQEKMGNTSVDKVWFRQNSILCTL